MEAGEWCIELAILAVEAHARLCHGGGAWRCAVRDSDVRARCRMSAPHPVWWEGGGGGWSRRRKRVQRCGSANTLPRAASRDERTFCANTRGDGVRVSGAGGWLRRGHGLARGQTSTRWDRGACGRTLRSRGRVRSNSSENGVVAVVGVGSSGGPVGALNDVTSVGFTTAAGVVRGMIISGARIDRAPTARESTLPPQCSCQAFGVCHCTRSAGTSPGPDGRLAWFEHIGQPAYS